MPRLSSASRPALVLAMLLLPLLALAGAAPLATAASDRPYLVHDPDPNTYPPAFAASGDMATVGTHAFFAGSGETTGEELWYTGGGPEDLHLAADILPGPEGSRPHGFLAVGQNLYFVADDRLHGRELWRYSAGVALLVRDVYPGPTDGIVDPSGSAALAELGGAIYFMAFDDVDTVWLWRSDGTAAGTVPLKRVGPAGETLPGMFARVGQRLFFRTSDPVAGDTLWRSDGTTAGTVQVATIPRGPAAPWGIGALEAIGETVYLQHPGGLWSSDGTAAGTLKVEQDAVAAMDAVGGRLIYTTGANSQLLKATTGAPGGAVLLKDFGASSVRPRGLAGAGALMLTVLRPDASLSLWRTDGTPAGTAKVLDLLPLAGPGTALDISQSTTTITLEGDELLFTFQGGPGWPSELWITDGTPARTRRLVLTQAGGTIARPTMLAHSGRRVFTVCHEAYQCGLAVSDGTSAGTMMLAPYRPARPAPMPLAAAGGVLFYQVARPTAGELWRSDGTPEGTWRLLSYPPDSAGPMELTPVGANVFFTTFASDSGGMRLWKSDGTPAGTIVVKELPQAYILTAALGALYFQGDEGRLWRSDGTPEGTGPAPGLAPSQLAAEQVIPPMAIAGTRGAVFFTLSGASWQTELWRSDGTAAGTTFVARFAQPSCHRLGCWDVTVRDMAPVGDLLFFDARPAGGAHGLWRSDGTAAGTIALTEREPAMLTPVGGALFFVLPDAAGLPELWRSDGTPAGTARLAGPFPGGVTLQDLTAVEDRLFFTTMAPPGLQALWTSDGTAAGTRRIADLGLRLSRGGQSYEYAPAAGGAALYFPAWSAESGVELWTSDGTAAGTRMVADIAQGPGHALPSLLMAAGSRLFFRADDGQSGPALFALGLISQPYQPERAAFTALVQAERYDRGGELVAYHDSDALNRELAFRPEQAVDVAAAPGAGGGSVVAWTRAGEWLNYTLDIAATRVYTLEARVAAAGQGGTFHLALDGQDWTGPLRVPDTGGWERWATVRKAGLALPAGRHTLTLVMDQDGASGHVGNFDWLVLRAPGEHGLLLPQVWQ